VYNKNGKIGRITMFDVQPMANNELVVIRITNNNKIVGKLSFSINPSCDVQ
jgi:hypothetical protein